MRYRDFTPKQKLQFIKDVKTMNVTDMCIKYGINVTKRRDIIAYLKAEGYDIVYYKDVVPTKTNIIVKLGEKGCNIDEIQDKTGYDRNYIQEILRCCVPSAYRKKPMVTEWIKGLFKDDDVVYSREEIAKEYSKTGFDKDLRYVLEKCSALGFKSIVVNNDRVYGNERALEKLKRRLNEN